MYPYVNKTAQAPPLVAIENNQLFATEHSTNMVKQYRKLKNTDEHSEGVQQVE